MSLRELEKQPGLCDGRPKNRHAQYYAISPRLINDLLLSFVELLSILNNSPCRLLEDGTAIMGKPRMIILIRHAQSEGNKNKDIHQMIPDHRVRLTPEGQQQVCD